MKEVFEKQIQLYLKYLTEDDLTNLDRLVLSNKKECVVMQTQVL
jgi:hypothetical protein